MKYFAFLLLPFTLFSDIPETFYYNNHEFIRFSENCIVHNPDCPCDDVRILCKGAGGWYLYKIMAIYTSEDKSHPYNPLERP